MGRRMSNRVLFVRTVAMAILFILLVPGIMALGTEQNAQTQVAQGGETLVIFQGASTDEFQAVVSYINEHGGNAFVSNPPNSVRAYLPTGVGEQVQSMKGVKSVNTGPINMKSVKGLGQDVELAVGAWNLHLKQQSTPGPYRDLPHGTPVTSIGDRSGGLGTDTPKFHDGIADISNDAIVCDDNLFCTADPAKASEILKNRQMPKGPAAVNPAPLWWQDSEFMLGTVGLAIVFPESNGSIDTDTETWTVAEKTNVVNGITSAITWWQAREAAEGFTAIPLSFSYKTYNQSTSYEPISRNGFSGNPNANMWTWMNEIMTNLGFGQGGNGESAFADATRAQFGADWGYVVWIARDQIDGDKKFADGTFGFAALGGPYVVMTYNNDGYGIGGMNAVFAHESGHTFNADDEYFTSGSMSGDRTGYQNVLNGNAEKDSSPVHITNVGCIMRGLTPPFTGNQICGFTKGQIGWNDTNGNHIPDVLDTYPTSTLDTMPGKVLNKTTYTYYGNASEVPLQNLNPMEGAPRHDCTINRMSKVEWRLDGGSWSTATPVDGFWSNQSEAYKFTMNGLTEGTHKVEVRATNNRAHVQPVLTNETFIVDMTRPITQVSPLPTYETQTSFQVNWTGNDGTGSGLKDIQLFYQKDNGGWKRYLNQFIQSPIMFSHFGDGFYEFYTLGRDNASNRELPPGTPDATTIVDGTPPVSLAGPLPAYTNKTAIAVPFKADDIGIGLDHVQLYYRKDLGPWASFGNFTTSPIPFTSKGDGKYDFYTVALDTLGNKEKKSAVVEAYITVDTLTPVTNLTVLGTLGDNGWYVTNLTITMSTNEVVKNIAYTKYRLDGGNWTVYSKGGFQITGSGKRTLEFYSANKAGNVEAIKSRVFKIDLTRPTGSIVLNKGLVQINDTSVDVVLSAKGNAPIIKMMVTEDSSFSTAQWVDYTTHMTYKVTSVVGKKTIYAQFKDEAGLISDVASSFVVIDSGAPTVMISTPANDTTVPTYQFIVKGTANDNVAVAKVEVTIDGRNWTLANGTTDWDAVLSVPGNGHYSIIARAFDLAGNKAGATNVITVDATLPTLSGTSPKDNSVSESKTIPVTGRTDPRATVKVNGMVARVDANGNFSIIVVLKNGMNTIVIDVIKAAGTIEKRIRVIYTHPPIIISDLKHMPEEPAPKENVTVSCVVPGTHITSVELKWKPFAKAEETTKMTKGEGDTYSAVIGPFVDGDVVEYYVMATDELGIRDRYPGNTTRSFQVHGTPPPPDLPPSTSHEDIGIYGYIFLLIVFAIFALVIGLSMMRPKDPHAAKKVSDRTAVERIDERHDEYEGSGFRDSGPRDAGSRYGEPPERDISDPTEVYSRFKDDKY